jgi:glycosyltransferase involved in cell wall biosynthesis
MGLGRQIFLKPSVPHRVVPRILANADIGVVGKRADVFGNEAFSTKIIEYMSQGLPVIAPRTKIDAYYFDDTCVRFYEPGDSTSMAKAMLDIHTNPPLRRALIDAGRRCAAKFSWETKKPDYLALVESLLSHDKLKT